MNCIGTVEVIGRTRLGMKVLYMENRERESWPQFLISAIIENILNKIILICLRKAVTLVMNRA